MSLRPAFSCPIHSSSAVIEEYFGIRHMEMDGGKPGPISKQWGHIRMIQGRGCEVCFLHPSPDVRTLHDVSLRICDYGWALGGHVSRSRKNDGGDRLRESLIPCSHQQRQRIVGAGRVADYNDIPRRGSCVNEGLIYTTAIIQTMWVRIFGRKAIRHENNR